MPPAVYETVMHRAGGMCEARISPQCTRRPEHWHHRQLRSGGGRHEVVNGIGICHECHGWIHANVALSRELGFIVSRYHDPAETPVTWRGKKWVLDEFGQRHPYMEGNT